MGLRSNLAGIYDKGIVVDQRTRNLEVRRAVSLREGNSKDVVGEISRGATFKMVRWAQSCGDGASEFGGPGGDEWGF